MSDDEEFPEGGEAMQAAPGTSRAAAPAAGAGTSRFNVLNHVNVPLHQVLGDAEEKALLKKYAIVKEQLPKIRSNDPASRVIGAKPGNIVRITRRSPTAGTAVAYRLVVEAI